MSISTQQARIDRDALHVQAVEFVRMHLKDGVQSAARDALMTRTVAMVMDQADVSAYTAETIAAHAVGEVESGRARVRIDLDRSTAYTVFVFDPVQGVTRAVTAAQLLCLLRYDSLCFGVDLAEPGTDFSAMTFANAN